MYVSENMCFEKLQPTYCMLHTASRLLKLRFYVYNKNRNFFTGVTTGAMKVVASVGYPILMPPPKASDLAKYFTLTQTQKLLRYGNYYTQLKPFLKVFKEEEIIFYNGNRLGKSNPSHM